MLQASWVSQRKSGTYDSQPSPQHPAITISTEPTGSTPRGPPPFVGTSSLFPLGTVPPDLNHRGDVLPGHYCASQIPFLFPPLGIFFVPVMASLVLPNITLGIPMWYIEPPVNTLPSQLRPYHALNPVHQSLRPLSLLQFHHHFNRKLLLLQKHLDKGAKPRRRNLRTRIPKHLQLPKIQSQHLHVLCVRLLGMPPITILNFLKPLVHETFLESNIHKVQVTLSGLDKKLKTLHTNHPCALYDHYGHYSHYFPRLDECHYEATHCQSSTPLPMDYITPSVL